MTLEELYSQIGGDYAEAIERMRKEELVSRFIVRFLDDDSCANMLASWEAGDDEAAFNAAHTAKGLCANLAITSLSGIATVLTEALRPGNDSLRASTDIDGLMAQFNEAYQHAVCCIKAYAEERA